MNGNSLGVVSAGGQGLARNEAQTSVASPELEIEPHPVEKFGDTEGDPLPLIRKKRE